MNIKKNISMSGSLKQLKLGDFTYPLVFIIFIGVTIFLFFLATKFISKNINKIFIVDSTAASQTLNKDQFNLVAKKLGIAVPSISTATQAPAVTRATTAQSPLLDKKAITLAIKNSTTKAGVATALAKSLQSVGFSKATTGNEPVRYATTTIFIKESKAEYTQVLIDAVLKIYPNVVSTTTPESSTSDAIIIIGAK